MKTLRGTIHGKTIELQDAPGLEDGSEVEVLVCPTRPTTDAEAALRRCAGILEDSWTPEDDRILDELRQQRIESLSRELPE